VACLSRWDGDRLHLTAAIFSADGAERIADDARFDPDDFAGPQALATRLLKEAPEAVRATFQPPE
jgi:hydroxymethylbilane synthase